MPGRRPSGGRIEPVITCPHCGVQFSALPTSSIEWSDVDGHWRLWVTHCKTAACGKCNIAAVVDSTPFTAGAPAERTRQLHRIWPRTSGRPRCPDVVPKDIAEDYNEACLVLQDSPKASAALSRRCLQHLLRDKAGVKPGNLSQEIQQVLDGKQLRNDLAEAIDAVRNIGNFAAHPEKSETTGTIVVVEPEEAEWTLDILEQLFDFYYVGPALLSEKTNALNKKLTDAGRSPMKKPLLNRPDAG
jgi:hypothetical protein